MNNFIKNNKVSMITKNFIQIYTKNGYGILSIRDTLIIILATIIFYYAGKSDALNIVNEVEATLLAILATVYGNDCIENDFFTEYHQTIEKESTNIERLIAANSVFFINIILNVISLTIIDIYFRGLSYGLACGLTMLCFLIFGLGICNLLMLYTCNRNMKLKVSLIICIFYFIFFYDISSIFLFLSTILAYGASLLLNKH
ncbi:hypothetical protein SAMN05421767_1261 [Granulicatella balaenopterae]|uniref:Uncharacterized protein n=1 Tax=Granulicatella balaenopterae TaxID=137733 RepID=A0A1H9MBY1_9LACT|nr:hypothetical protein [Granulicatella balaenopterae]SER21208.1 hypothetical protein SAMN05421767_1261 [Granulicatella balaenopterae]